MQGKCKYAKLLVPSKEEGGFKSKYSIEMYVSDADMQFAKDEGIDTKEDKEGVEFIRFWTNGKRKDGTANPPVRIVDLNKKVLEDDPGNGSVVNVQYTPVPWKFGQRTGIFGALGAVQVVKLIPKLADEFAYEEADPEAMGEFEEEDIQF